MSEFYEMRSERQAYGCVGRTYREADQTTTCVITFCDASSLTLEVTTGHANKDRNKGEIVERIADYLQKLLDSDSAYETWRSDIPVQTITNTSTQRGADDIPL
jgi:hypothetical protein